MTVRALLIRNVAEPLFVRLGSVSAGLLMGLAYTNPDPTHTAIVADALVAGALVGADLLLRQVSKWAGWR